MDGITAVGHADGLYPLGPEGREVVGAQPAARLARPGVYALCESAAVEALAVRARQLAQGLGVAGQADHFPGPRRAPAGRKAVEPGLKQLVTGLGIGRVGLDPEF